MGKKSVLFLVGIFLFGCREDGFKDFVKDTENSTKSLIYDLKNFNLNNAWYNIKTAYNIANRSRYFEEQVINVETSRNTQIAGFQSVLNECLTFKCNVLEKNLIKNLLFPENIVGRIELDIDIVNAPDFVNSISKYGNIVRNDYKKDEYIDKDLALFYDELIPLRSALLKINEILNKDEVYSFDRIKEMQDYAEHLNKKIYALEESVKYLTSLKNKRHISIKIERGYNSMFGFVKSRVQNACLYAIEYAHVAIIIAFIYLIVFAVKKFSLFIKKKLKEEKRKRDALKLLKKQEFKIPPRF